jgi:hypothetical protein
MRKVMLAAAIAALLSFGLVGLRGPPFRALPAHCGTPSHLNPRVWRMILPYHIVRGSKVAGPCQISVPESPASAGRSGVAVIGGFA